MKKPHLVPDNIFYDTNEYTGDDGHLHHFRLFVTVGGKEIDAQIEWLSEMDKSITLREALEIYPANPRLAHADGGGAWAADCLDETVGAYLMDGVDRVMKVTLDLRKLGIRSLGEVEGLDTIPRVDELNLSGNQLDDDAVAALARMPFTNTLRNLVIYNNQITKFPTSAFPILEHLIISQNRISGVDVIEASNSLEWLHLAQNGIKAVFSTDIAKFPSLIKIDLSNNELSEVPDLTSLENTWDAKLNNWQVKPLSNLVERRLSTPKVLFVLVLIANPIISVDPLNAAFIKANVRDGKLVVNCDESVRDLIERA
ncbi:MAG: hypothetical protein JW839_19180 [Candidatus Lokiarchaeota archaeon]|nr:hypothetical protein [Candidatus Lokiarchaeota archaeon]